MAVCSVCREGRRGALLCPDCFSSGCAGRRADLRALTEQRDAAAQDLAALVEQKVCAGASPERQRVPVAWTGGCCASLVVPVYFRRTSVLVFSFIFEQEVHQRQQLALLALSDEVRCTRARAADTERQAAAVRQRAATARAALAQRQAALAEARQHLAMLARDAAPGSAASAAAFDQQALACQRVDAALREQRSR